jgi:hypothetical protein
VRAVEQENELLTQRIAGLNAELQARELAVAVESALPPGATENTRVATDLARLLSVLPAGAVVQELRIEDAVVTLKVAVLPPDAQPLLDRLYAMFGSLSYGEYDPQANPVVLDVRFYADGKGGGP